MRHTTNTAHGASILQVATITLVCFSVFTCLFSFQMTSNLGQEEGRRARIQSLEADLEEAIPNSMERSLAEVNQAPPSATRMAPDT